MKNKEIEELLKNCKIWVKTDDIDYTRWFGLYELSLLLSYIEQLENNRDKAIEYVKEFRFATVKFEQHSDTLLNILKGDSE